MFFGSFTINVVDPQIVFNDGFYELVDVRIPQGTLLNQIIRLRFQEELTLWVEFLMCWAHS